MRAVVVYESLFGNTRAVAEAVAAGLRPAYDVTLVRASVAQPSDLDWADLVVAAAPTHAWGLPRPRSRQSATAQAAAPASGLRLEPDPTATGLRELLDALPDGAGRGRAAVAFDTRIAKSPLVTGRAAPKIGRQLRRAGFTLAGPPESFLVAGHPTVLVTGEEERARHWAAGLADRVGADTADPAR